MKSSILDSAGISHSFQVTMFLSLVKAMLCCEDETSHWFREQNGRMQQCRLQCGMEGSAPLCTRLAGSLLQIMKALLELAHPSFGQSSFGKAVRFCVLPAYFLGI